MQVGVEAAQGHIAPLDLFPSIRPGVSPSSENATIQRIPSLIDATSLSFRSTEVTSTPPLAPGGRTEMIFSFTPIVEMDVGDEIVLHLPGFHIGGTDVMASIPITNGLTIDLVGTWQPAPIPLLKLAVQKRLPEGSRVEASIPASTTIGVILPAAGVSSSSEDEALDLDGSLRVSATVNGVVMQGVPIENFDAVDPSITGSRLSFGTPRAGELSEISFSFSFGARLTLQPGDALLLEMPGFVRKLSTNNVVGVMPAGNVSQATWHSSSEVLTVVIASEVSGQLNLSVPLNYGLYLPARGLTLDTASGYTFAIHRNGNRKLLGKTPIAKIDLVAAFQNPLMRFSPGIAGEQAEIQIWITFTGPLSSGTTIKWRLPGFEGESVENILTTSYPANALPEASWLSDGGDGAGVLSVRVGSKQVDAGEILRIQIPWSAGIRLPSAGLQDCIGTSSEECQITVEVDSDSPTTASLLRSIFRGSEVVGVASMASVMIAPRQIRTPVALTFSFRTSFDARPGDLLEIALNLFKADRPINLIEYPEGLCGATKCFRDVLISYGTSGTVLFATMDVLTSRGSLITLTVPKSAGIPCHVLFCAGASA
jgi:hypothetical protein